MPLDPVRLSPRDIRVIGVFGRHPAADLDAVRALACPSDSLNAVGKLLRRKVFSGWLASHRLPDGSVCYTLTRRAARALGLPRRRRRGLTQEAVVQHFGTLRMCLELKIRKCSVAEFRSQFPEFLQRGLPATSYGIAPEGRLLWLIIDHRAKPTRLAAKSAEAVAKRERLPAFRDLIDADGFGVLIGVPSAAKAVEVETAFNALHTPVNPRVPVRAVVVPGLASLLLQGDRP